MGVKIVLHGHMGSPIRQDAVANDYNVMLRDIFNSNGVYAPATHETNMIFSHWSTTISGDNVQNKTIMDLINDGYVHDDELELYANYTYNPSNIQVTFNGGGGTWPDGSTSKVVTKQAGFIYAELANDITSLPVYTVNGVKQAFQGWFDGKGNRYNSDSVFLENLVVTAAYTDPGNATITVKDPSGGTIKTVDIQKGMEYREFSEQVSYSPANYTKPLVDTIPGSGQGSTGSRNALVNTEFENWPFAWKTQPDPYMSVVDGYNGSKGLKIDTYSLGDSHTDYHTLGQDIILVPSGSKTVSLSAMGYLEKASDASTTYVNANVTAYDEAGNKISNVVASGIQFDKTIIGEWQSSHSRSIGVSLPSNVHHLKVSMYVRGAATFTYSQPIMVFDSTDVTYTPGVKGLYGQVIDRVSFTTDNYAMFIDQFTNQVISDYQQKTINSFNTTDIPYDFTSSYYGLVGQSSSQPMKLRFVDQMTANQEGIIAGIYVNSTMIWSSKTLSYIDTSGPGWSFTTNTRTLSFTNPFLVYAIEGSGTSINDGVLASVEMQLLDFGVASVDLPVYPNRYFYGNETLIAAVGEKYGYAGINFLNPNTGYTQYVVKPSGTIFQEFIDVLDITNFTKTNAVLTGYWWSGVWAEAKLLPTDDIHSIQDNVTARYYDIDLSDRVAVTASAGGGLFYSDTPDSAPEVTFYVNPTDSWSMIIGYIPNPTKGSMNVIYWYLPDGEPAYTQMVNEHQEITPKYSIQGTDELKRYPREYWLVDMDTILDGWDLMEKRSLSNIDDVFVIDPKGVGTEFENTDNTSEDKSLDGWNYGTRKFKPNNISFTAYYNDYQRYVNLGSWMSGRRLGLVMLNDTGKPTYWAVGLQNWERTEIKYNKNLMEGALEFVKMSPPFELEFIGLGTDNVINNDSFQAWKNSYVYMKSLRSTGPQVGTYVIAKNGSKVYEDRLNSNSVIPVNSYILYSTIPFMEAWKYGSHFNDYTTNLYTNIDLVGSRPLKLPKGLWDISMSSQNLTKISDIKGTIQDHYNDTIDSLGSFGPFVGIALKEKEI